MCLLVCVEQGSTVSLNMPPNNLPLREPLAEKLWASDQATDGVTHTYTHMQTAWRTHTAGTIWLPLKLTPPPLNHKQTKRPTVWAFVLNSAPIIYNHFTRPILSELSVISQFPLCESGHMEQTLKLTHLTLSFCLLFPLTGIVCIFGKYAYLLFFPWEVSMDLEPRGD